MLVEMRISAHPIPDSRLRTSKNNGQVAGRWMVSVKLEVQNPSLRLVDGEKQKGGNMRPLPPKAIHIARHGTAEASNRALCTQ